MLSEKEINKLYKTHISILKIVEKTRDKNNKDTTPKYMRTANDNAVNVQRTIVNVLRLVLN